MFGRANLILAAVGLVGSIAVAPVTATQLRHHAGAPDADPFTAAVLCWALGAAGAAAAVLAIGWTALRLAGRAPITPGELALGSALLAAKALRDVLANRPQAERRQAIYVGLFVAEVALSTAATGLLLTLAPTAIGFLTGQALGALLCAALACAIPGVAPLWSRGSARLGPHLVGYGAPFALNGVLNATANLADRYVLGALAGATAVGSYAAPFALASRGMGLLNGALNDIFRPALFQAAGAVDGKAARQVFRRWLVARVLLTLGALAALYLFGPLLAETLLAPAYRAGAVAVMLWVGAGYALFGIATTLDARILSFGGSARILPPLVAGAAANLGLSLWLIPGHGIVGAAQASCGSYALQCLVSAVMLALTKRRPAAGS